MTFNGSSLNNHQYYNNYIESFETSIPHIESTSERARVTINDQYLLSPFNLASSSSSSITFSYFPNQLQEGSVPFHNDLPSGMEACTPSRESTCDQQNVTLASYAPSFIPNQHNFTLLMPAMGIESLPYTASSSSCGQKLNGLKPFQNNMSGLADLEGTDGMDGLADLHGVVPIRFFTRNKGVRS